MTNESEGLRLRIVLIVIAAAIGGMLVLGASLTAENADAQGAGIQYPDGDVGPAGGTGNSQADEVPPGGPGPSTTGDGVAGAGDGKLPFTGYPLTSLILLLLALLATGLLLRAYVFARERIRRRPATLA